MKGIPRVIAKCVRQLAGSIGRALSIAQRFLPAAPFLTFRKGWPGRKAKALIAVFVEPRLALKTGAQTWGTGRHGRLAGQAGRARTPVAPAQMSSSRQRKSYASSPKPPATIADRCCPPSLSSVAVDKVGGARYTELMRLVELRLLLVLVLVLLGATVMVGLNLGDNDNTMAVQNQTQPLRARPEETTLISSIGLPSSAPHPSHRDPEISPRSDASVIALVCVLRC